CLPGESTHPARIAGKGAFFRRFRCGTANAALASRKAECAMKQTFALALTVLLAAPSSAQESHHDHPAPEKLGLAHFETSCLAKTNPAFSRAVALLHSFAYSASHKIFAEVAASDPNCAMALWGEAITHYHALWEPQVDSDAEMREAADEIARASAMQASPREKQYIAALAVYYRDFEHAKPAERARRFAGAMAALAKNNPKDEEAQVFHALMLVATASPTDGSHATQKQAAAILEPRWKQQPQ